MRLFRRWQQRLTATVLDRDETAESVEAAMEEKDRHINITERLPWQGSDPRLDAQSTLKLSRVFWSTL